MSESKLHVLLVGGEPYMKDVAEVMMSSLGHTIAAEPHVTQAVERATRGEEAFDLYMVDVEGPEGLATITRMREHPRTAGAPILCLANERNARQIELALRAGASHALRLPFKRQDLAAAIATAIP
ncbi:MAG: hypothetical protein JWM80_5235 [Cyanobacteria bacterium RYN_339]|nr:hypothetical protein [Cyanobacteria bacterium RYN_339]